MIGDFIKFKKHFVQGEVDERWIKAIEKNVGPWINEKGKSYWDVVSFASYKHGIIDNLSAGDFAEMAISLCPKAFQPSDTAKRIADDMYKCPATSKKKKDAFDDLPEGSELKRLVAEVYNLLSKNSVAGNSVEENSMENCLGRYLKTFVATGDSQVLRANPHYSPYIHPAYSIEKYFSKDFKDKGDYSYRMVYECLPGKITTDDVFCLIAKYKNEKNTKLVVVSEAPIHNDVKKLAQDEGLSWILWEPNAEITEHSIVLPRVVGDYVTMQRHEQIIDGRRPMESPLLFMDGTTTTSMAEWLSSNKIFVNPDHVLKAPIIPSGRIEEVANSFTNIYDLRDAQERFQSGQVATDIVAVAEQRGLSIAYEDLPDNQVGRIDLRSRRVSISRGVSSNCRVHFTLGHEVGHDVLHGYLADSQNGVSTFGDNHQVIFDSMSITNHEMRWFEVQANSFAAFVLMPTKMVEYLYKLYFKIYQTDVYGDKYGPLYWNDNNPFAIENCKRVMLPMAYQLQVSLEALKWRLYKMNLLNIDLASDPKKRGRW